MDNHIRILFEDFLGIRGNAYAPWPIRCADYFAEVTPDFCRIRVDGADNFNGLLLPHQARNGCANRAHAILDGANFLFHVVLRCPSVCAQRAFSLQKKPYDNGISARIQRRSVPSVRTARGSRPARPELLPELGLHRIMAGENARQAGGMTDRKSTRLNSSHVEISYAVFCLKK